MKLSRTVTYGVEAMLLLAESKSQGPVPCSKLSAEGRMPERFLLQILRNLVTHGLLRSTRGVDGGYSLKRSAKEISLLDVIEAIEGPLVAALPAREGETSVHQAKLHGAMEQVAANVRRQLQGIKLADLVGSSSAAKMA
jgi:Rrf2 family protein